MSKEAMLARLQRFADDPMWADHAEVPKALLREAIANIRAAPTQSDAQNVTVPREPTGEMCFQGERAGMAYLAEARADMTIREARPFITAEIYKAMVACAVASAQSNNGAE